MLRTEKEIRDKINDIEMEYAHVLSGTFTTVFENIPRVIMQLLAKAKLEQLYFVLGEQCPKYEYEKGDEA